MLKLDDLDGTYILFGNHRGFIAVWEIYCLFDGKAQKINIIIEGDPSEISKAEQIIKSFKPSAK